MATTFDPINYKKTTHDQWQVAAEAWNRWGNFIEEWLGNATTIMLDEAGVQSGDAVLDVAAGAGEQSLTIAHRVGPTGKVLATDISANILRFAEENARRANASNIETRVMDGENLEFAEGTFNEVVSRVGLIYFPDQQRALKGMHRVLKPGGRIAAIVYSTPDKNAFFSIPVSIIRRRAQLPPPLPGQPGPFSLGAPGILESAFKEAGFHNVRTQRVSAPLHLTSAFECVRFERESFGALHQMLAGLDDSGRAAAWEEIEQELRKFESRNGFEGPCEMIVATGIK
jgi:SAM-dependent methyltransferase